MTEPERSIAIGRDERTPPTDAVVDSPRNRGFHLEPHAALTKENPRGPPWPARSPSASPPGHATRVSVLLDRHRRLHGANTVRGARPALCADAEVARATHKLNNANILCVGPRLTSTAVAEKGA